MSFSDPVADLLTRIRNAINAEHRYVDVKWSQIKENIVIVLRNRGLIESFLVEKDENQRGMMRIFLKYKPGRVPVIQGIKRISKPGLRRYLGYKEILRFYGGYGISILSTSQGILDGDEAYKKKIGGELLCLVW